MLQTPVSILMVDRGVEALAIRSLLEQFNYRVEIHAIGSRRHFLEILQGKVPTFEYVIISGHGLEGAFLLPDEPDVMAGDLDGLVALPDKVVISTCCETGIQTLAAAFLKGGCAAYIAPQAEIEGNAAVLFVIHLFYHLAKKLPLTAAVELARTYDNECALFKTFA